MTRKKWIIGIVLLLTSVSFGADVWRFELAKVQPTWNIGSRRLTVPVEITVYLNIDGAGEQVYATSLVSATIPWGSDLQGAYVALREPLQGFIDKCKKERLAMKSAQFTSLVAALQAGLVI